MGFKQDKVIVREKVYDKGWLPASDCKIARSCGMSRKSAERARDGLVGDGTLTLTRQGGDGQMIIRVGPEPVINYENEKVAVAA